MTAKEMHIEFTLGFQKLGANSRRKFYPEEIDSLLNKAMDEFVADQVKESTDDKGFQHTQIDADKIRPLISRDWNFIATKAAVRAGWTEYAINLPGNYAYLISDRIAMAKKCSTTSSSTHQKYMAVLDVPNSTKAGRPYYATFTLADSNISLSLSAAIPYAAYTGYSSQEQKFEAVRLLIELFYEQKKSNLSVDMFEYELYWERFGELYYPGKLILVKPNSSATTLQIDDMAAINGVISSVGGTMDWAAVLSEYPSRLTKASVLDNVLTTPYYKPQPSSPVSTIYEGRFRVCIPSSYIVNSVFLTYIRKAARINLSLQRNCELAPEFHRQIVDRAVALAAKSVEQANLYQAQTLENAKDK